MEENSNKSKESKYEAIERVAFFLSFVKTSIEIDCEMSNTPPPFRDDIVYQHMANGGSDYLRWGTILDFLEEVNTLKNSKI